MKKFKLNSIPTIVDMHRDLIFPGLDNPTYRDELIRSVSFTHETLEKLNKLRAKHKLTRSALIRILIEQAPL